jgi:hypothetical protein
MDLVKAKTRIRDLESLLNRWVAIAKFYEANCSFFAKNKNNCKCTVCTEARRVLSEHC